MPPETLGGEEHEHPGLAKVKTMWERGDFDKIDKMVRLWDAMESLGMLGGIAKRFILWSGVIAAGYLAFNGWLVEWIRNIKQ